ncbi:MAG: hypothetical protein ABSE20_00800 [Acetobacteraceae bacterium]|jgi:hypothetical protein
MAISVFSVGRDTQLVVVGPSGTIDLAHVTSFESRQVTQSVRVNRLDGSQMGMELPKGWEGSFELERGDSVVEDFIAGTEQSYYDGSISATSTMYQYVSEVDGSTSTYQYDSVVFRLTNAGLWKGDAAVKQKLEFFGSRRRRI